MYKLLTGGTKNLKQCLISVITTAGFDLNSPCNDLRDYCVRILHGIIDNENQFIYICELDEEDIKNSDINVGTGIWDEKNWPKASPLWTPETLTSLRADLISAKDMGGNKLRDFMTKGLNV